MEGVRVVELGSLIAGPFAGRLLADFGAEVIKVENSARAAGVEAQRLTKLLTEASVPVGLVYTVAGIFDDPYFTERRHAAPSGTRGTRRNRDAGHRAQTVAHPWTGGRQRKLPAGRDNDDVHRSLLGLTDERLTALLSAAVI